MLKKWYFTFGVLLVTGLPVVTTAAPPPELELVSVASGLNRPVAARHAGDGSGRLFIVEQTGRIRILDSSDALLATPFIDISSVEPLFEYNGGEQGLLGMAFDPDFANNGYFYVNYTYDPGPGLDRTRVSRFSVSSGNDNLADAGSEYIIIEIEQDAANHNGGDIHFGPDGYLYIGMGDGGPSGRAQTLDAAGSASLLGKMLRIDVHGGTPEPVGVEKCGEVQNYTIPHATDNGQIANPWLGADNVCDEIWTYGWRNPWRWSFDSLTGDMFIGDVGQGAMEEVSFQAAGDSGGGNYGWNCKEGSMDYWTGCGVEGVLIDPILEYPQAGSNACAVTGGYVYRGAISEMRGDYVYADYCDGRIWFASQSSGNWVGAVWQDTVHHPSSFGEDEAGELYLVHVGNFSGGGIAANTGVIYRFEGDNPDDVFEDGFEGN